MLKPFHALDFMDGVVTK